MKGTLMGWTIPTPVLAALGGYLFTYYNTRITEERKARIERVNDQARPTPDALRMRRALKGCTCLSEAGAAALELSDCPSAHACDKDCAVAGVAGATLQPEARQSRRRALRCFLVATPGARSWRHSRRLVLPCRAAWTAVPQPQCGASSVQ
jgi:hypothetical protein